MLRVIVDERGFKDLVYSGPNPVEAGNMVYTLSGPILESPTRTSIQIAPNKHMEDSLGQFINHSCHPSVQVRGDQLVALQRIQNGDSITFDYNKTEDVVSHPFVCHCCETTIKGSH